MGKTSPLTGFREPAAQGKIKIESGAAEACAKACADAIGHMKAYKALLGDNSVSAMPPFAPAPVGSGMKLASRFNTKALDTADLIDKHITLLTDMGHIFIDAGKTYVKTDGDSATRIAALEGIELNRDKVDLGYSSQHWGKPSDDYDEDEDRPSPPEALKAGVVTMEGRNIPPDNHQSLMPKDLVNLHDHINPGAPWAAGQAWNFLSGKLYAKAGELESALRKVTTDSWQGFGAGQAVEAINKYGANLRTLSNAMDVVYQNLDYTSKWLYSTQQEMPDNEEDAECDLQEYRDAFKATYLEGLKNTDAAFPNLPESLSAPNTDNNGRNTPGNNQPNPGANQPNPGNNQPNPGSNQPNPGANQPNPGNNQPNPGANQPNPGNNHQPNPGNNHQPNPGNNHQPNPGANQPTPGSNQPTPGSNQPVSSNPNASPGSSGTEQAAAAMQLISPLLSTLGTGLQALPELVQAISQIQAGLPGITLPDMREVIGQLLGGNDLSQIPGGKELTELLGGRNLVDILGGGQVADIFQGKDLWDVLGIPKPEDGNGTPSAGVPAEADAGVAAPPQRSLFPRASLPGLTASDSAPVTPWSWGSDSTSSPVPADERGDGSLDEIVALTARSHAPEAESETDYARPAQEYARPAVEP